MFKVISLLCSFSVCTVGYLYATSKIAIAQVTSDDTVNTQVTTDGNVDEITGGETRGDNLFHSFQDFSVPTNNEAFFNNANNIANIFSRVTGGKISNIDGLIRANGSASLFLINPAGILFGSNASLNIGGSFYGSTADSILFEDGEFSATDLDSPPLLTINAPIGLNFRDNPGDIINRSVVQHNNAEEITGLEVASGNNLTLVGGNIKFEGGNLTASGGRIELGGLSQAGKVTFNGDGSLNFPVDLARADLTFSDAAQVDVTGTGGGDIAINARNFKLEAGDFGASGIYAGISVDSTDPGAQAGDITINTTDNVTVDDDSIIYNQVEPGAVGNGGDVTITTDSLSLTKGGRVRASTRGRANAGSVAITASDMVTIDGEDSEGSYSGAISRVEPEAVGDGGDVTITTDTLSVTNGGRVNASTKGQGNAGSVAITAGKIAIDGEDSEGSSSGAFSRVEPEAVGDGGDITITTDTLSVTNGGVVNASTRGQGNAGSVAIIARDLITIDGEDSEGAPSGVGSQVNPGAVGNGEDVTITTDSLSLTKGAGVSASTRGQGNGGNVEITAGKITINGEGSQIPSGAFSVVAPGAVGNGGDVTITTNTLSLIDGGTVNAGTFSQGNGGSVEITAGKIAIDSGNSQGFVSGAFSAVTPEAVGNGGDVTITTDSLSLTNGGAVDASALGQGNAGSVNITATDTIIIDGENSQGNIVSGASSNVNLEATGDAGDVTITTGSLSLTNGGAVSASTRGQGNAGGVEITATNKITIDGEGSQIPSGAFSGVAPGAVGNGGDVTITTGSLSLTNGGAVSASTRGQGNAGSVAITATDKIAIDGENSQGEHGGNAGLVEIIATGDITFEGGDSDGIPSGVTSRVNRGAEGDAGGVRIETSNLTLTNGGRVSASTFGQGNAGSVEIIATSDITFEGENSDGFPSSVISGVNPDAKGDAGGVRIETDNLALTDGSVVSASTGGQGNAGLVEIIATGDITFEGETSGGLPSGVTSQVNLNAEGDAGGVRIETSNLALTDGSIVSASTGSQGNAGDVTINATKSIFISGATETEDFSSGVFAIALIENGNGGNVNIFTNQLTISNGGTIGAGNFDSIGDFTPGTGQPGNITIEANSLDLIDQGRIEAATSSNIGESANINLEVADSITLRNNSFISARAFEDANGGNLTINTDFIIAFPGSGGNNDIFASAERGIGGNISINAESLFGIEEGPSSQTTNDINASSDISGLDGTVDITTPDINPIQGAAELPSNLVVLQQTTAQACQSNREAVAQNGLTIKGKGGVPPAPELPLDSQNIAIEGEYIDSISATPQPVETSQGKIQPARGIKETENGIVLTAYPTNNAGDRLLEIKPNCGV